MSDPAKAIFLSYASQDAEAAKRICETQRAAGVEVWFDRDELVGGDAGDQKIRKQVQECVLFLMPSGPGHGRANAREEAGVHLNIYNVRRFAYGFWQ